jgi:parvulin-like peptidyl-prolyl isomerase
MNIKTLFFSLFVSASVLFSGVEPYDKIVAVVDGEIILHSDLMSTVYQLQNYPGFKGLPQVDLEKKVLNQLIDDKVLLAIAVKDTLAATEDELEQKVNEHLNKLASSQKMNLEQLAQAINQQMGISVKQFKNQLKVRFKEDLSKQKIKGRYIGMKTPTPGEVVEFYKGYKDSLPSEYNSYKLRNLQVNIKVSPSHLDSILSKAKEVAKKLNEGHAFEKLAEEHSDDESTKFY